MNRTAIVTGGARGIGEAITRKLYSLGYNVLVNYNTSEERATNLKQELGVEIYKADVSNYSQVKAMVEYCVDRYGKVDLLVNNAGISSIKPFLDINEEEWDRLIAVNLKSVYNCSKNVLEYMINRKEGNIINISSMWGMVGASCEVHYSTSKAGIIGFTKALAKEFGPSNIRVNCISPGVIASDMNNNLDLDELIEETPLGMIGQGNDIAEMVAYLDSEKAGFITGQNFGINGGLVV